MNERTLLARIALLGDSDAFGVLVEKYQSPLRGFFLNLTGGDRQLSDDLAQETFIKAWLGIGNFRSLARFSTWLYRIGYNTFYDHCRSNRRYEADLQAPETGSEDHKSGNGDDFGIDFRQALTVLNPQQRAVMHLFYYEDKTVAVISQITGMPTGTVKSHLAGGRKKLSEYFKDTAYETK